MTFEVKALGFSQQPKFPKAEGYNIQVGAVWYRTIAKRQVPIQIGTRDSLAPRLDDNASTYNNILDVGYAWGRTDISGGEGLDWDPREIALETDNVALDPIRYWDSEGISTNRPAEGEQYVIQLAPEFTPSPISVTAPVDLAVSEFHIFIADGETIVQYDNWNGDNPVTLTGLPGGGVLVRAIACQPNDTIMAVMDDGDVYAKRPSEAGFVRAYDSVNGPSPVFMVGNWDYDTPALSADPVAGQIVHANDLTEVLKVSKTDSDTTDRTADLAGVRIGDKIQFNEPTGIEWIITSIVDHPTWVAYSIVAALPEGDPAQQATPDGITSFAFETLRLEAQGIWYVNGRFILSTWNETQEDAGELRSIDWINDAWTAELGLIDTASSQFWSVVESGPAIAAACGDGTIRTYTPDSQGATPSMVLIPRARTTMPEGETPILLGSNAGILLIQTTADHLEPDRQTLRLYQAEVLDARFDYSVGQLQLKRAWTSSEHEGLVTRNMTSTRDEIFFFVKEENREGFAVDESLWRYDVITGGLSRVQIVPGVNLNGVAVFNQTVGGIDFNAPAILVADFASHQTEGYVIFPNITFGLNTPITWIATVIEAHDLQDSGGQVELFYSTDVTAILDPNHPSWVLTQRLSSPGGSGVEIPFANLRSRTLSLQLRMKATAGATVTPKVTRIALRGIPSHRDLIMMVPFNISDYVSAPGRRPMRVPGLGYSLHREVLDLVGNSVEAIVIDPPMGFRGVVNNVSEPIELLSNRGSVTTHVMVEFRGQRLTQTVPPTGDAGMGLAWMGIDIIGIGQSEDT